MESYLVPKQFDESDESDESDASDDSRYDDIEDPIERFELDCEGIQKTSRIQLKKLRSLPVSTIKTNYESLLKVITQTLLDSYSELIDAFSSPDDENYKFTERKVEKADIMFQYITNKVSVFIETNK
jgi:hypothetical protein